MIYCNFGIERRVANLNVIVSNQFSEFGFNEMTLLTGLALCFRTGEKSLSIREIIDRKFAPSEQLCRDIIALLIRRKLVKASLKNFEATSTRGKPIKNKTLSISLLQLYRAATDKPYSTLRTLKSAGKNHIKDLEDFLLIILSGECIDYSLYLAGRLDIELKNTSVYDKKLHMLLASNTRGQIFKLIWLAMNDILKIQKNLKKVTFVDLMDRCYVFYNDYLANHYNFEVYNWPKPIKHSYLSNLIIYEILEHRDKDAGMSVIESFIEKVSCLDRRFAS